MHSDRVVSWGSLERKATPWSPVSSQPASSTIPRCALRSCPEMRRDQRPVLAEGWTLRSVQDKPRSSRGSGNEARSCPSPAGLQRDKLCISFRWWFLEKENASIPKMCGIVIFSRERLIFTTSKSNLFTHLLEDLSGKKRKMKDLHLTRLQQMGTFRLAACGCLNWG